MQDEKAGRSGLPQAVRRSYWRARWVLSRALHRGRWPMPEDFDRMSRAELEAFIVHIGFDARIRAVLATEGTRETIA